MSATGADITPRARRSQASLPASTDSPFLSVAELAVLLHLNEKKVYQLAGDGSLPGTKITGKWLFPRSLIEQWIIENSHGGVLADRLLIAGSDDRLVHKVCGRLAVDWQRSALLAYCPAGTRHGLSMLDAGRVDACFINWGAAEAHGRRHRALLRGYRNHASWTVVRCFERNQGVLLGSDTSAKDGKELLNNERLRWALRDGDTGTDRILADACAAHGVSVDRLNIVSRHHSERAAAAAVAAGEADATPGVESVAHEYRLEFLAMNTVAIDLVLEKRTYFRQLVRELLKRLADTSAADDAAALGGYRLVHQELLE